MVNATPIALVNGLAPWFLAAYLLVPTVFKASLQPHVPIDLTVLIGIPTAAIGLAWLVANHGRLSHAQVVALALWAALGSLVILGVLWAPETELAFDTAARWGALATIPLLAALPVASDEGSLRRFLLAFVAVGVFLILVGLAVMPSVEAGELELLGTNRLGVARVVLLAPLIALPLVAWTRRGPMSVAVVLLISLSVFVATATGSRASLFAFGLLGSSLLLASLLWSARRGVAAAIAAGAVGMTLVVFLALGWLLPEHAIARFGLLADAVTQPSLTVTASPTASPSRVGGSPPASSPTIVDQPDLEEPGGGESVAARIDLAKVAQSMFARSPVVGAGTAGFAAGAARSVDLGLYDHPHNLVLHFAADFGLVGLTILGGFTVWAGLRLWRTRTPATVALALALGFLLANAMLSNGIYDNRMLWGFWLAALTLQAPIRSSGEGHPD